MNLCHILSNSVRPIDTDINIEGLTKLELIENIFILKVFFV